MSIGLVFAACGAPGDEAGRGENEEIGQVRQAIGGSFDLNGFRGTWTQVGRPHLAIKIATCGPQKLFALNDDFRLYANTTGGNDAGWSFVDHPSSAREIACDGKELFALNFDKNLYATTYSANLLTLNGFQFRGFPFQAGNISGGYDILVAHNVDRNMYTSDPSGANLRGSDASWVHRGLAHQASRVTAAGRLDPLTNTRKVRGFALNDDDSLWYNDTLLSGAFTQLPASGIALAEISAAAPNVLYGLADTKELWRLDLKEINCTDSIDNDSDARIDAHDPDCFGTPPAAKEWEVAGEYGWGPLFWEADVATIRAQRDAGKRIVDIDVVNANPLRMNVVFSANSGALQREWEFYPRLSESQIKPTADALGLQPVFVKPYSDGGTFYAVVMVKPPTATSWELAVNWTFSQLATRSVTSRLVDFEPMPTGSGFVAVFDQQAPFRVLLSHGAAEGILTWLDDNPGQRLVAWRTIPGGFGALSQLDTSGVRNWKQMRLTRDKLVAMYGRQYSRPVDIEPRSDGTYDALFIDNGLPTSAPAHSFNGAATFDNVIKSYMKDYAVPGMGLALVKNGRLIYTKGYGVAHAQVPGVSAEVQAAPNTLFRIGSVSKSITAAAFMKFLERVPAPTWNGVPVTPETFVFKDILKNALNVGPTYQSGDYDGIKFKHLLSHSAGFPGYWNPIVMTRTIASQLSPPISTTPTCQQTIKWMLSQPIPPPDGSKPRGGTNVPPAPGTQYAYFNTGPCAVSAALEVMSGKTFENFVRDELMTPRNLQNDILPSSDFFSLRAARESRHHASLADFLQGRDTVSPPALVELPSTQTVEIAYGGIPLVNGNMTGGFAASPVGFARFVAGLDGTRTPRIVSQTSWNTMKAPSGVPGPVLGFHVFTNTGRGYQTHGGAVEGGFGHYATHGGDGFIWTVFGNSSPWIRCGARIWANRDFTGQDFCLGYGWYSRQTFKDLGIAIPDNFGSSLEVAPGVKVTIYDLDNFGGTQLVRRESDRDLSGPHVNVERIMSSIVVEPSRDLEGELWNAYQATKTIVNNTPGDLFTLYGM
jgi:CubicO group peptidase (beta-lactamase class C family)